MAEKKNIHTVPTNDGWANRREDAERASSTHATKAEAQEAGRATAKKDGVEHLVHKKDGTIGENATHTATTPTRRRVEPQGHRLALVHLGPRPGRRWSA